VGRRRCLATVAEMSVARVGAGSFPESDAKRGVTLVVMAHTLPLRRYRRHTRSPEIAGWHARDRPRARPRPGVGPSLLPTRSRVLPTHGPGIRCDHPDVSVSVLLIDDDPAFRRLARRVLTATGVAVVGEADTVASGLARALDLRPDALLVDVGLPDGDGTDLAAELTALPWRPRVVLTSVDPDAASADDVRRSGASGFVAKDQLPGAGLKLLLAAG
jgi:CheY-like chemotaxis protein